jgi:excinuclease UvrABC nuclease subunit
MGGGSLNEPDIIKALFDKLMLAPLQPFPKLGEKLNAPTQPGIYVLYGPKGKVIYVGLARGVNGIRPRLMTHLRDSARQTFIYGSALRSRGGFRYLVVESPRQRALLKAYATGCLCPAYIGGSQGLP